MKVNASSAEHAIFAFLEKLTGTMPSSGHKFVAGAMIGSSARKLKDLVNALADEEGHIDTSMLREVAERGFSASGDRVTFTVGDDRLKWILPPVDVSVDSNDIEGLIRSIETSELNK